MGKEQGPSNTRMGIERWRGLPAKSGRDYLRQIEGKLKSQVLLFNASWKM